MADLAARGKKTPNHNAFSFFFYHSQPTKPPKETSPCHEVTCLISTSWLGRSLSTKHTTGGFGGSSTCWVLLRSSRLETLLYSVLLTLKPSASHSQWIQCLEEGKQSSFINKTWPGRFQCSSTKLAWADLLYIKNSVASLHIRIREKIKKNLI